MKLSRLYSNKEEFQSIEFAAGLNAIFAEIRLPENKNRDTHNLGKTTVGSLLDFLLLNDRDSKFFLFRHFETFKNFTFYLEITIEGGGFLTIRRSVEEASKISLKRHRIGSQDYTGLEEGDWDHWKVPFERAKTILDGLLDWRTLKPWSFRKLTGYLLRTQKDYLEVFQLDKFASKHSDWKPFLAHILGFDGALIDQHYDKEEKLADKEASVTLIKSELGQLIEPAKIDGVLLLKRRECDKKEKLLDAFDFRGTDKECSKHIVEDLDVTIADLNGVRYSLNQKKKRIEISLAEDQIIFNPDQASEIFEEVGIFFNGQLKRDFAQLISFNRAISLERRKYLEEELETIDTELKAVNSDLSSLGKKRSEALAYLSETDVVRKYKEVSDELVTLRADIEILKRQKEALDRLQVLRSQIRTLNEEKVHLEALIESDTNKKNSDPCSIFSHIRVYFSEIVEEVIDRKALLTVTLNTLSHLEFRAEILDAAGNPTGADVGTTYRKLLCIAFDLALLRAHLQDRYPRFVYHDGPFEGLDQRKKGNLLSVIRQYAELGIQPIITLIDSDCPPSNGDQSCFSNEELVLMLHDEGDDGRLFRMPAW